MRSFDPIAEAIDWLDAYRATSLSIVEMYAAGGALECSCGDPIAIRGREAITEYWKCRFIEKPAGELLDLQAYGDDIVVNYEVPGGMVEALLHFDGDGKIKRSLCWPIT
jgi:hypothetical protein